MRRILKSWPWAAALTGLAGAAAFSSAEAAAPSSVQRAQPATTLNAAHARTLREARNELLDRWVKDPAFNASMRRDPVGTIERMGITLTPQARKMLVSINWSTSNQDVLKQVAYWDGGGDLG